MPLFARRRLQAMIDELGPDLDQPKVRDLLGRLENRKIDQALPAEMELALLWALRRLGPIEIEPEWCCPPSEPDAYTEELFPGHETIVEVAAVSDASLPGDKGMRNAAAKLRHLANGIRRGAGRQITCFFHSESGYRGGTYFRRVKAPRSLIPDPELEAKLRAWLRPEPPAPGNILRLTKDELDVELTWHESAQHHGSDWCSMPPEVHDPEDNYLWRRLEAKANQLRGEFRGLRCLFLADVGSTLLRRLTERDWTNRFVNGEQIVRAFLERPKSGLDVVVVFSPNRFRSLTEFRDELRWKVSAFVREEWGGLDREPLDRLARTLPPPRFEGYQARHLHEQGLYAPDARPWSLGTRFVSRGNVMEIKVSSRTLLEVLAGRAPPDRLFERPGPSILTRQLELGRTLREARLEHTGPDEDDDLVVFTFQDDPAAQALRPPARGDGS